MSGLEKWSLQVTTALGDEAFTLETLEAEEALSQPFLYALTMTALQEADPSAVLGKPACVTLLGAEGVQRSLHGVVTRLTRAGPHWTAELRPWFWELTLARDSRVFQSMTIPTILSTLFKDFPSASFRDDTIGSYATLDYCVQYQETAFDFASRLMEEAGIGYHFEHSSSAHTLVMTDDPSAFKPCPGAATLPFRTDPVGNDWIDDICVMNASLAHTVVSDGFITDDFNFITPTNELRVTGQTGVFLVYDYPGRYDSVDTGQAVAKRRLAEMETDAVILSGESLARPLLPGKTVSMTQHPVSSMNGSYTIRSVRHTATRRTYRNSFTAIPAAARFCPARRTPTPRLAGAQTAIVVGPQGKEIWTDKYGRIKVQFHWDRRGKNDDNSSCWVRVSQSWSGVSWGGFVLPRIGQEVVVTFLDGDPDRPLVTGCVYNGNNPVPYTLPDGQTRSTFKTRSTPGGGGFNEIRFEDNKDKEELFIQAQKDMTLKVLNDRTLDVGHDDTTTIKNDRSVTIAEGSDSLTITKGGRTVSVEAGDEALRVKGARLVEVAGDHTQTTEGDFNHTVAGAVQWDVDGNIIIQTSGNLTLKAGGSVTLQSGSSLSVKAGSDLSASAGAGLTAKAGTALTLTGGTTMSLKGSASGAVDGGSMLTVKGAMVKIN